MLDSLRRTVTTPVPEQPKPLRGRIAVAVYSCAAVVSGWFFLYQFLAFRRLSLTSDLFSLEQLSRTWLHGRFFWENCYGNQLSTHTYLLCLILAVLTVPLGAIGLLLASALALASCLIGIFAIGRLFKVPDYAALAWAVLLSCCPMAIGFYQDPIYGFHIELLEPAFAIWFAYFLLQRRWIPSMALGCGLLLVKEDTPLLVVALCAAVMTEDLVRSAFGRRFSSNNVINWPVVACALVAIAALPLLLWIIKSQPIGPTSAGNFNRLRPVSGTPISGTSGLARYVIGNLGLWLGSPRTGQALLVFVAATFGLIVLRPICLFWGLATILVSWLMQDDLLWPPRFAGAFSFLQVVGTLGFASAWSLASSAASSRRGKIVAWAVAACIAGVLGCWAVSRQASLFPGAKAVYKLAPRSRYTKQELRQADRVFSVYRRQSSPADPVSASKWLFRYAHDRDLYWTDGLNGGVQPVWVLRDFEHLFSRDEAERLFDPTHVELVAFEGRFALYRRRAPGDTYAEQASQREWTGTFRLHLRLPQYQGTVSEPLVSTGAPRASDLIFINYFDPQTVVFVHDSTNGGTEYSAKIPVDYSKEHVLDIGISSLGSALPEGSTVEIALDGRIVMVGSLPFHPSKPYQAVCGYNACEMGSAVELFHGDILKSERLDSFPVSSTAQRRHDDAGPLKVTLTFPQGMTSGNEPVVATGVWGKGDIVFVRYLGGNKIQFGADHWGTGVRFSPILDLKAPGPHTLVVDSAALEPPVGSPRWATVSPADQQRSCATISVWFDGRQVLSTDFPAFPSAQEEVVVGSNSISGSTCGPSFTGIISGTGRLRPGFRP
ncbi:MAG TPA: DUF2079 domain-containing protein [Opitutaceae bacterium]|jgi:hypothetical protein